MEFSQAIFKRRIVALLPDRPSWGRREESHRDPSGGDAPTDLSDLPQIGNDEGFLREAYRRILGRECDPVGFVNYREMLHRHVPRRVVLLDLINSPEARGMGTRFTGIPGVSAPDRRPVLRSLGRIASGFAARLRATLRRVLYTPFETLDHKLDFLLRESAVTGDRLSAKTDEALWTLSVKLDAYLADVEAKQRDLRSDAEAHFQAQDERFLDICRTLDRRNELRENTEALRELDSTVTLLRAQQRQLRKDVEAHLQMQEKRFLEICRTQDYRNELHQQTDALCALREMVESLAGLMGNDRSHLLAKLDESRDRLALQLDALGRRSHPPVFSAGNHALITEVDGFIVAVPVEEWRIAAYHAFRGVMEPGTTRHFCRLIQQGMVVVDIGANIGMYTLHAARLLGQRGKIFSFEPAPRTFEILKENVQVNGFLESGVIELSQAAVTDTAGTARLTIFPRDSGHNTLFRGSAQNLEWVDVRTVRLDEILSGQAHVDVVKIDAEGAEPSILRGMQEAIVRNPDIQIVLEFSPQNLRNAGVEPEAFLDEISATGLCIRQIHEETGELVEASKQQLAGVFSVNLALSRTGPRGGRQ